MNRSFASSVRPRHLRRYLSIKQLAVQLDFVTTAPGNPEDACRTWLRRHHIVGLRRGRVILVDPLDIEHALRSA